MRSMFVTETGSYSLCISIDWEIGCGDATVKQNAPEGEGGSCVTTVGVQNGDSRYFTTIDDLNNN